MGYEEVGLDSELIYLKNKLKLCLDFIRLETNVAL